MNTYSKNTGVYLGRDAGKDIHSSIRRAKYSVKIVSPYLSPQYVKELVHLARKGTKVTLITSDRLEQSEPHHKYGEPFYHQDLIKQKRITDEKTERRRSEGLKYSCIAFFILFFLAFFPSVASPTLAILSGLCVFPILYFYQIRIYKYSYYPIFKIKVFSSYDIQKNAYLIHSKIFVIDDKIAYLGSTNFTYHGFVKNYESAVRITDRDAIKSISKEVTDLFYNKYLPCWDIQEWGRKLYDEPPH